MNLSFANLLQDAPPGYVFELSEPGVSFARVARPPQVNFAPLPEGAARRCVTTQDHPAHQTGVLCHSVSNRAFLVSRDIMEVEF